MRVFNVGIDLLIQRGLEALAAIFIGFVFMGEVPDPFYHSTWMDLYWGWSLLVLVTFIAALFLIRSFAGRVVLLIIAAALAVFFGINYGKTFAEESLIPFLTWLSHWLFVAVAVPLATFAVALVIRALTGLVLPSA